MLSMILPGFGARPVGCVGTMPAADVMDDVTEKLQWGWMGSPPSSKQKHGTCQGAVGRLQPQKQQNSSCPLLVLCNTGGTHKGLIQVGHLLLQLWRLDVGVGHAHHNHTPGGKHREANSTWALRPSSRSHGPGWRMWSPLPGHLLRPPLLSPHKLCSALCLLLPTLYIPPGEGFSR